MIVELEGRGSCRAGRFAMRRRPGRSLALPGINIDLALNRIHDCTHSPPQTANTIDSFAGSQHELHHQLLLRRRTGEDHEFQLTSIGLHVVRHEPGFTNDGRQPFREFIDERMMQRAVIDRDEGLLIVKKTDLWIVDCTGHRELCPNATACDCLAWNKWQNSRSRKQLSQNILLVLQRGVVWVVKLAAGATALRLKVFAVHQLPGIRLSV